MTKREYEMLQEQLENVDKTDFWAKNEQGFYFHICEGTGDNLLKEDVAEGYVDYIYYSIYDSLRAIHEDSEYDGGMVLLKEYYQDMDIVDIVNAVGEMEGDNLTILE